MRAVAQYVTDAVLKRGKVRDLSLQYALFYSCSDNFITYFTITTKFTLAQKFSIVKRFVMLMRSTTPKKKHKPDVEFVAQFSLSACVDRLEELGRSKLADEL
jgi:hypothetical protein